MKKNNYAIGLVSGLLIILLLFVLNSLSFNYSISSRGILMPSREWTLARTTDGNLINSLKDNTLNTISEYSVTEFQRGDFANFAIDQQIFQKNTVNKGDTIGKLLSLNQISRHTELQGELIRQQKLLSVYATGERPEDINVAFERMVLARSEYHTQERINNRNKVLFERRHIPEEEFEISENLYQVAKQNYLISKNQYEALLAGAKQEQLDFINANISAIETQIALIEELMEQYTITSPITGKIIRQHGIGNTMETILRVFETDDYRVMFPLNLHHVPFVRYGQEIQLKFPGERRVLKAKITGFDNSVQMIDGRQKIFAIAIVDEIPDDLNLLPNLIVEVNIPSEPLSAKGYLMRLINEVYHN